MKRFKLVSAILFTIVVIAMIISVIIGIDAYKQIKQLNKEIEILNK